MLPVQTFPGACTVALYDPSLDIVRYLILKASSMNISKLLNSLSAEFMKWNLPVDNMDLSILVKKRLLNKANR